MHAPTIADPREMIGWQFPFLEWKPKGKYPAILDQPIARELFGDANTLMGPDHRRLVLISRIDLILDTSRSQGGGAQVDQARATAR